MKHNHINMKSVARLFVCLTVMVLACGIALAYETYSVDRSSGNCAECHGGFRTSPYVSLKDGVSWGDDLHDVHRRQMMDSFCDGCHEATRFPEEIAVSNGGNGWDPIGCVGCHGRTADGSSGTLGTGAGLRQHHYVTGTTDCLSCHADADPAAFTPVGEDILPPYYATGTVIGKPTDPCNPNTTEEDYSDPNTIGLDNDGDDVYDMLDTDCSGVAATPGESSADTLQPLLVTAFDSAGGTMSLSYEAGCSATDHNLEWGPIGSVASYGYSAQTVNECGIGAGGTYVWSFPATPDDIFFLIVGNDGSAEGSLGLDSANAERPENSGGICDVAQSLADRCD